MKQVGGFFTCGPLPEIESHCLENLYPPGGSLCFFMSGRCANYYVLQDIRLAGIEETVRVPVYTCETVSAPFPKAGYELLLYDVSKDLTPISDERVPDRISVISLRGYYGFCSCDEEFIRKCPEWGTIIVEDTTHSLFSSGDVDPHCDYMMGSMRKWTGVPAGGPAIKGKGSFFLLVPPSGKAYLSTRSISTKGKQQFLQSGTPDLQTIQKLNDTFWDAEMMLHRIFDSYRSGWNPGYIIRHYDSEQLRQRRRTNYQYLLDHVPEHPQPTVIFPVPKKGAVPSHFTTYTEDKDMVRSYLAGRGIKTTTYWPQGSMVDTGGHGDAAYICNHVLSFTCDQRYETGGMEYICKQIEGMPEK